MDEKKQVIRQPKATLEGSLIINKGYDLGASGPILFTLLMILPLFSVAYILYLMIIIWS